MPHPHELTAAHAALGGRHGFLPLRTPADALPSWASPYQLAALELPQRYHRSGGSVRPWLAELFHETDAELIQRVDALAEPAFDRLHTLVAVLCHAFRWHTAPPPQSAYEETRLSLPPGLSSAFIALARRGGHPRVGNLYTMVLSNWRLDGVAGGECYDPEALAGERILTAVPWLAPPESEALSAFLRTGIETEARGARAVATAVGAVGAVERDARHEVTQLLERLHAEIVEMGRPFKAYIQKARIGPDTFLTLIQPTTLWLLDEGDGPLEGASGPQVGALQTMDVLLGISRDSPMGQSCLGTRAYLPTRHRRFLEVTENWAHMLPTYVERRADRGLTTEFNACVGAVKAWRLVHQKRGAIYLRGEAAGAVAAYTSTGGVVALADERVSRFEESMQARVEETAAALVSVTVAVESPEASIPAG